MKRAIIATLTFAAAMLSTMAHGQQSAPQVPLMLPASDSFRQSFVRLSNRRGQTNNVRIIAVDDGGNVYPTVAIQLARWESLHFNSGDLADGNPAKGIEGIGAPIQGNWRLHVESDYLVAVSSFIRTPDGFLTPMYDVMSKGTSTNDDGETVARTLFGYTFNPASNVERQSRLRLINYGASDASFEIIAVDDTGDARGPVSFTLLAGHARTLTAVDLEEGAEGLEGKLGDGKGKWLIFARSLGDYDSIDGQSLLYSASGHISDLSWRRFSTYVDTNDTASSANPIDDIEITVPAQCATAVNVCVRDHQCEDGDEARVTVNGNVVFEGELFNAWACKTVDVNEGTNRITFLALNGSGFKGACSYADANTGQLRVTGQGGNTVLQSWYHSGGKGSIANLDITVGPRTDAACDYD